MSASSANVPIPNVPPPAPSHVATLPVGASASSATVPTPNVSLAILNLTFKRETTAEEVNEYVRQMSLHSSLRKQIDFINSAEVVSTDFVGSRRACVFDAQATIVNGKNAVLYIWYDNEFGYACQVHRVMEKMAGVSYALYPKEL